MAAIAYPYRAPSLRPHRSPAGRARQQRSSLYLVAPDYPQFAPRIEDWPDDELVQPPRTQRRSARSRFLTGLLSLLVLVATYFGAGLLVSAHDLSRGALPGARPVPGGYAYVVHSGDTLWSIATRLDPSGDPRPLVAELTASLHGSEIRAGEHIVVPLH